MSKYLKSETFLINLRHLEIFLRNLRHLETIWDISDKLTNFIKTRLFWLSFGQFCLVVSLNKRLFSWFSVFINNRLYSKPYSFQGVCQNVWFSWNLEKIVLTSKPRRAGVWPKQWISVIFSVLSGFDTSNDSFFSVDMFDLIVTWFRNILTVLTVLSESADSIETLGLWLGWVSKMRKHRKHGNDSFDNFDSFVFSAYALLPHFDSFDRNFLNLTYYQKCLKSNTFETFETVKRLRA